MKSIMNIFRVPTAQQLANAELQEAQRELLKAQSGVEFAVSSVQYHNARVRRLSDFLKASPVSVAT